ncbi:cyclic nucleotide-binding domain-containing protein [Turneriella parva]|uniref:Cyclic nucleotide-binding protein n=1 Tax=Turneriella parva (strain ATCC BAA-1111 / DSM 21527 / NCTC 11395 / H) TaxID=869212 RepID=I4B624_TURPD|nr:cyclic nucleotide-binding domain-containing protein [Turneriella parva]AFM12731.1 cyclic nucleotide-binding protein [Turneriella parva DSM 21527]
MFDLIQHGKAMPQRHLRAGDYVYRAGKAFDGNMYIVLEGEVVRLDHHEAFIVGSELGAGQFFGDVELMAESEVRLQTFKVKSLSATLAIMDKKAVKLAGGLHPQFFLNLLRSAIDNLSSAEQYLIHTIDKADK